MGGSRVATHSLVVGISVGSVVGSLVARRLDPARLAGSLTGEARSPHHRVTSQACILGNWGWQWLWQDHLSGILRKVRRVIKRKQIPWACEAASGLKLLAVKWETQP